MSLLSAAPGVATRRRQRQLLGRSASAIQVRGSEIWRRPADTVLDWSYGPSLLRLGSPRKLKRIVGRLASAAGIGLAVVPTGRADELADAASQVSSAPWPVAVSTDDDFEPLWEVGVPTLLICDSETVPQAWLDGSGQSRPVRGTRPPERVGWANRSAVARV